MFRCQFLLLLFLASGAYANQKQEVLDDHVRAQLKQAIASSDSFEDRFDAEVWLFVMSDRMKRFEKDPQKRFEILRLVHAYATKFELEPELVLAVIQIESAFDPYAISVAGAQGIMQVMPFWKNEIGSADDNLINLETNIRYGCAILKHYLDREKGDIPNALARYNGSYGSTKYSRKVMRAWELRWQ